jgi:muconate cycloisomerase
MKIVGCTGYLVQWPFRIAVEHSLAANRATLNLVLELRDDRGRIGLGEGVPRAYVTGESLEDSLAFLRSRLLPAVLGVELSPAEALGLPTRLFPEAEIDAAPAAACALETALLDLAGQELGQPVSALLGGAKLSSLRYSGVLPLSPLPLLERMLEVVAGLGLTEVKVKVGLADDLERVDLIRRRLGPEVRLRVDANGAWGVDEALERIEALAALGVESVEQPVPAGGDQTGLAGQAALLEVARRAGPLVIADESLCTLAQGRALAESGVRVGFNLRLSKCGGFERTLALLRLARASGLPAQLGCQVGELGVLSAAGRHFAAACPDLIHLEGSLTSYYLDRDLIDADITFGRGGLAPALTRPGLGVRAAAANLGDCQVISLA